MTKTARSTLTNALSLVQHELSNSKIELARKELMECRDTIEYAIWSLDNAHEAGDVNKAVFRIWPEFFLWQVRGNDVSSFDNSDIGN